MSNLYKDLLGMECQSDFLIFFEETSNKLFPTNQSWRASTAGPTNISEQFLKYYHVTIRMRP